MAHADDLLRQVIQSTNRIRDQVELEHRLMLSLARTLSRTDMRASMLMHELQEHGPEVSSAFWAATAPARRAGETAYGVVEWTTHARDRFAVVLPIWRQCLLDIGGGDINVLTNLPTDTTSSAPGPPLYRLAVRDDNGRWLDPGYRDLLRSYVDEFALVMSTVATAFDGAQTNLGSAAQELGVLFAGSVHDEAHVLIDNLVIGARAAGHGKDHAEKSAAGFADVVPMI